MRVSEASKRVEGREVRGWKVEVEAAMCRENEGRKVEEGGVETEVPVSAWSLTSVVGQEGRGRRDKRKRKRESKGRSRPLFETQGQNEMHDSPCAMQDASRAVCFGQWVESEEGGRLSSLQLAKRGREGGKRRKPRRRRRGKKQSAALRTCRSPTYQVDLQSVRCSDSSVKRTERSLSLVLLV
jgi:hypothetical protein